MADLKKVRVQLLNPDTNEVVEEVNVLTSADSVTFADGETFQQKLDAGKLKGQTGTTGAQGATGAKGADGATWLFGTVAPTSSQLSLIHILLCSHDKTIPVAGQPKAYKVGICKFVCRSYWIDRNRGGEAE